MTACNYTPSQIDDMEFLDVLALIKYWSKNPPMHELYKMVHVPVDKTKLTDEEEAKEIKRIKSKFAKSGPGSLEALKQFAGKVILNG